MATDYSSWFKLLWQKYGINLVIAAVITLTFLTLGFPLFLASVATFAALYAWKAYKLSWDWTLAKDHNNYLHVIVPTGVGFGFGLILAIFL